MGQIRQRGRFWQIRFYDENGKRREQTIRSPRKTDAIAQLRIAEGAVASAKGDPLRGRRFPRNPSDRAPCCFYVATDGMPARVKIGITYSPERRRRGIQTGNPGLIRLRVLAWFASRRDALRTERWVKHALRGEQLQGGDWYGVTPRQAARALRRVLAAAIT
jgi:hypothetical protein